MNSPRLSADALDRLCALTLGLAYVGLLFATSDTLGYARDEGFYFAAADSYDRWFQLLFSDPARALERPSVDRFWAYNHEHPSLMKALFALSHRFLHAEWGLVAEPGTAYRLPGMLMSGIAVGVTARWGARSIGRWEGILAGLLLTAMPRVFYHAHLACFDMPVAAMWLVTTYAYFRSLERPSFGWVVATGVLYGLLLDTKHNAWLLPPALVAHFVITRWRTLRTEIRGGRFGVPPAWLAMATIGPLVFYLSWPWIWFDTGRRLLDYVAFHTGHEYYNMEFWGRTYWKPPFPLAYAPVMTLATVPAITLALFGLGVAVAARRFAPLFSGRAAPAATVRGHLTPATSPELLWLVCLLMSYAPWLSSGTPIFGGTKHWITAYPFLCLFAGLGFRELRARAAAALSPRLGARAAPLGAAGLFASVVAAPLAITLDVHPWGLSAYTPLVGGAPGAASLGLNRTFWGYTTGSVTEFLNRAVPPNGRVFVHDTAMQSFEMLRADGRLRADIRPSWTIHGSDFALYHHEPHMSRVEYQIWVDYGTTRPVHVGTHDGVPVVWVYARQRSGEP